MSDPLGLGKEPASTRVVVAMSGGVDSSVAAALVARWGYEAVGVTLQLYDHGAATGSKGACCAGQDIHDARRVADRLGIPHYVLDFERRFEQAVIDDFAATYAAGRTPIPCVRCNQRIKFRDLMAIARDLGADALVTGHYARRLGPPTGGELHRAVDAMRDQTYFLFATTRDQLDFLRFPLGGQPKARTRALAAELELPVAAKAESQDICFVPQGHYSRVVERLRPEAGEPGPILDEAGRELGRHQGLAHYTVGQRRGLKLATGTPLYVLALDAARRAVIVGPKERLRAAAIHLGEVNWLGDGALAGTTRRLSIKHRANEAAIPARLEATGGGARVVPEEPTLGVAPGQACVFYDGTRVLGGGWIERVEAPARAPAASA
ncbi:MAG: tRNA 2-thiouridine(34) synthase MnmA [Alphaproteobacteria bacterium]